MAGAIALKVGTLAAARSRAVPGCVAFCLLAVTGVPCLAAPSGRRRKKRSRTAGPQLAPAGIAAALLVYPILLRTLSFLLSTFIVLFVLFRLLGFKTTGGRWRSRRSSPRSFSFIIFAGLLGVVLPSGAAEQFILNLIGAGLMEVLHQL